MNKKLKRLFILFISLDCNSTIHPNNQLIMIFLQLIYLNNLFLSILSNKRALMVSTAFTLLRTSFQ